MSAPWAVGLALLVVWELAWKGWALWRAARRDAKAWFVVLLVLNTAGVLEIVYIFGISPRTPVAVAGAGADPSPPAATS